MAPQIDDEEEKQGQPIPTQPEVAAPTTQPPAQMAQPSTLQPTAPAAPAPTPQQPPAPKVTQFGPQAQQLQQPVSQPKTTTSTPVSSFTRLQQYLQTSQPQARGLGSALQSQITSQAAMGRQALGQAAQSFGQQVEAAGLTRNETRVDELIKKAQNLKAGQTLSEEEFKELEDIAKTKETFGSAAPADLTAMEDFASAQENLGEAKERAGLTRSTAGLKALLEDILGKGRQYKGGESLLDAILTGSSKVPAEALTGLRSEYVDKDMLMKEQETAFKAAQEKRALEESEIAQAAQDVTSRVGTEAGKGILGTMEKAIKDRIAEKNAQVEKVNRLIAQASASSADIMNFGNTDASKQLVDILHLTPSQIELIRQTGGRDPGIFQTMRELNEQTGTTKDEFAELQALYRIGERFGRKDPRIQAVEREDLGSLVDQTAKVDWDKVQSDIRANKAEAKGEVRNLLDTAKTVKTRNYRFGRDMDFPSAAMDIYQRAMTGGWRPDIDVPESAKVIDHFNSEILPKIQQVYAARGLPTPSFAPTNDDIFSPTDGTMEDLTRFSVPFEWTHRTFKGEPGDQWGSYISLSSDRRIQMPYGSDYLAALQQQNPKLYQEVYDQAKNLAYLKNIAKALGFWQNVYRTPPEFWDDYLNGQALTGAPRNGDYTWEPG